MKTIGVDLGGTKIEAALVDEKGRLEKTLRVPTDVKGGVKAVENQILGMVEELCQNALEPVKAIGVGVPGQVVEKGVVFFAPNLYWHQVPLQDDLVKILKLPVAIINDVRAIAWGEWLFGAGKKVADMVCVFVGTGIGSGIVSGGRLLQGNSQTFGEVGHMSIDLNGPLCTCGNRGCWESLAGGWGIGKRAQEIAAQDPRGAAKWLELAGGSVEAISAKVVVAAYKENDPPAVDLIDQVKKALIAGCVNLVNLYNPQRLVLGGGVLDGMPELIPEIAQGIQKNALKAAAKSLEVVSAELGKESGVIGAAAIAMHNKRKEK